MGIFIGLGSGTPTSSYDYFYGVEIDTANATTVATRVGRPELHVTCPIQNKMRRCVLKDDGSVAYYLDDNDSTKTSGGGTADLSGAAGQVMVEIPDHYRRFEFEGTVIRPLISEYPLPGFDLVPKMYISAYEATVERETQKLASVCNKTAAYRGGNNNAAHDADETGKSQLGVPATVISLTNFRTYAQKRGAGWQCYTYKAHVTLFWLFVIEYATTNCQAAYNAEKTPEGYRQGGLGAGVTTLTWGPWSTMNGNYPFIPCGHTNSLGNKTGVVNFDMPSGYGSSLTVEVPSYHGVENLFGHLWKWTDGVLFDIQSATGGGESRAYAALDPADYNSTNFSKYQYIGNLPRTEGYVKELMFGERGDMLPKSVGGSSSTFWSDYFYTNIPKDGTALRGLLLGGTASNGSNAGLASAYSNFAPSDTFANFGSRLCFLA